MRKKYTTFYFNLSTADQIGVGFFKYRIGPQEGFLTLNNALLEFLGYDLKRDIKSKSLFTFFADPADKDSFLTTLKEKKTVRSFQTRFKRRDGKKIWVAISASLIESRLSYIEGIIENITTYKEMEEHLSLERDFLQSLLDNIPDAVYFKDKRNRIIKVNKFYAKGVGLNPEEIVGKSDFDFFPYDQAKKMFEDDNYVLRTGKPIVGKIERTLLPDGSWNQVITTKIPMYDREGKIIGTMGITRDMTAYAHLERERLQLVINALEALTKALEMRDPYTYGHTRRVALLAESIAKELGWNQDRILAIKLAGELHDIGKICIPSDILAKPGRLTDLEYKIVQDHVEKCYQLLKGIESCLSLAKIIYQHHERLDGSGYPQGLRGDAIMPEARILAISDVLEAMTYRRPYREALGLQTALEELRRGSGIKYDKDLIEVVLKIIERNNYTPFWLTS
jgi:PAS domain S-box-containing protein/putative nucleotidyltransferase with HDIG domain